MGFERSGFDVRNSAVTQFQTIQKFLLQHFVELGQILWRFGFAVFWRLSFAKVLHAAQQTRMTVFAPEYHNRVQY